MSTEPIKSTLDFIAPNAMANTKATSEAIKFTGVPEAMTKPQGRVKGFIEQAMESLKVALLEARKAGEAMVLLQEQAREYFNRATRAEEDAGLLRSDLEQTRKVSNERLKTIGDLNSEVDRYEKLLTVKNKQLGWLMDQEVQAGARGDRIRNLAYNATKKASGLILVGVTREIMEAMIHITAELDIKPEQMPHFDASAPENDHGYCQSPEERYGPSGGHYKPY